MHRLVIMATLLAHTAGALLAQANLSEYERNWPAWRGPLYTGVAPSGNPPVEWSEDKNIAWKVEIPGIGHATPIVWKDQMILLAAVKTDKLAGTGSQAGAEGSAPSNTDYIHEFVVISVHPETGKTNWQVKVHEQAPFSGTHQFGSWASNSPITDGEHIYAYFGSYGLYCLDMQGKILWERNLGRMEKRMNFGEGSSPVIYKDKLIILRDHEGQSTLHVMDKRTGKDIWKADRDEISSWATPVVIEYGGRVQIITSATARIKSYDLETGEEIWEGSGMTQNVIPTPLYRDGILYLASGYRGNMVMAVDLPRARGNVDGTGAVIWKYELNTPYTPSPVLMDDHLYFLRANNGYLTCLKASDGSEIYTSQRLEGIQNIFTSPLGVMDRIYIQGTEGTCVVVRHGDKFEVLARNTLDDSFYASPVVIGNRLYLKGDRYLYCISGQ